MVGCFVSECLQDDLIIMARRWLHSSWCNVRGMLQVGRCDSTHLSFGCAICPVGQGRRGGRGWGGGRGGGGGGGRKEEEGGGGRRRGGEGGRKEEEGEEEGKERRRREERRGRG